MSQLNKYFFILNIGIFGVLLNAGAQELNSSADRSLLDLRFARYIASEEMDQRQDMKYPDEPVVVESRPYVWDKSKDRFRLPYYRYRKSRWGLYVQGGVQKYNPSAVRNKRTLRDRATNYEGTVPDTFEVQISPRLDIRVGTIAFDVGYSSYSIQATDGSAANLSVSLPRVGATFLFDTLFKEPYVVPYASLGFFQAQYNQSDSGTEGQPATGTSPISSYFSIGLLLQLNWIDSEQAALAFDELGLENSYIFGEYRTYTGPDGIDTRGLASDETLAFGLRLEF